MPYASTFLPGKNELLRPGIKEVLLQDITDDLEHHDDKAGGIIGGIGQLKSPVVFLLALGDELLNGEPGEEGFPTGEQEGVPEPPHAPVPVCKGVDELELVVEDRALDERVQVACCVPRQQVSHLPGNQVGSTCVPKNFGNL